MGSGNSKTLSRKGLIELIDRRDATEFLCEEHSNMVKMEEQETCNASAAADNGTKNRYADAACFNYSEILPGENPGYESASYIDGFQHPKKYIACSAPLENTRSEFWKMVWEHKSQIIVMLCNTVENGKRQCYHYWSPVEEVALRFGKLKISTVGIRSSHPDFIITDPVVTDEDGCSLDVTHFLYGKWQEHDLSPEESDFIDLVVTTQLHGKSISHMHRSPIVVHCNSGLERSMVFCAVDICLTRLEKTGKLDVFSTVLNLRKQRHNCLSNVNHYIFIYTVLYDYIKSYPKLFSSLFFA